ncbi:hypothetical protein PG984_010104 [Apiospora sp. TS-2023a]
MPSKLIPASENRSFQADGSRRSSRWNILAVLVFATEFLGMYTMARPLRDMVCYWTLNPEFGKQKAKSRPRNAWRGN